ncbi:MAG: PhoH family protein [Bacteroidetes bacterium]|nr:PhoH family protein [Bacteroidota bacterium]MDA1224458.1 PhoH family protein [Bacteroidota bacterium]
MSERIYTLDTIDPQQFYGPNNLHLTIIKSKFPKLQFIARGDEIKIFGDEASMDVFQTAMKHLEKVFLKSKEINEHIVLESLEGIEVVKPENTGGPPLIGTGDVLLIGTRGQQIKARTRNQVKMVNAARTNDIVFAIGPAGTGKTYTAVAIAVLALKEREIRRIILTRPAVEAGENLGFLPGDLKEKIDPYLRPLYDALEDMIPNDKLKSMVESRTVEIAPLAFMRGRTLDNCYVILDEAQNSTDLQLKMFLTRMGPNAKLIITGDLTQIDLPRKQQSGLGKALRLLKNIKGIAQIQLDTDDVVRHRLVKEIVHAYDRETECEKDSESNKAR